jgi:hypothetical protein
MNCDSSLNPRSNWITSSKQAQPSSHTLPFFALTNGMDYNATYTGGAGPSSYSYGDFHALVYPHDIPPEEITYIKDCQRSCDVATCNPAPTSSSTPHFPGMFDPEFFDDYHTDFFHPDSPSSASSTSEATTPISSYGESEFLAIASGSTDGGDVDMDASLGGHAIYGPDAADIPADFSDLFLAASKTTSDNAALNWPQLLAIMCNEHPEAVRWFAEMGGFQPEFDQIQMAAPQNEHAVFIQSQISAIYPQQHSDTLSNFVPPSSSISAATPVFAPHPSSLLDSPSLPVPLQHPRPVRPIPQIPLKDLAAVALRLGKPRGPRGLSENLPLLCQPVGDAVRYQRKPLSAGGVNAGRY